MNTWLAIAAIAVTCVFFVWILTRQAAQQRAGTLHHPEDEQLRKDADTRDEAMWSPQIPWRDGQAPPAQPAPAVAAPDAVTSAPVLPQEPEADGEAGTQADAEDGPGGAATSGTKPGAPAQDGQRPETADREAAEAEPSGPATAGPGQTRTGSSRMDASRTGA